MTNDKRNKVLSDIAAKALAEVAHGILFSAGRVGLEEGLKHYNKLVNNLYTRVIGLPFVVLGNPGTGKTTLLDLLKTGESRVELTEHISTRSPEIIEDFEYRINKEKTIKLRPQFDVPGEAELRNAIWTQLLRDAKPTGIIFLMDHTDTQSHKEALSFIINMIDKDTMLRWRLKAFLILINKQDLWSDRTDKENIWKDYFSEDLRLRSMAERHKFKWKYAACSLTRGVGISEEISNFLNAIGTTNGTREVANELRDKLRTRWSNRNWPDKTSS